MSSVGNKKRTRKTQPRWVQPKIGQHAPLGTNRNHTGQMSRMAKENLQMTRSEGPLRVDFVTGAVAYRARFGGGLGQDIAKAMS